MPDNIAYQASRENWIIHEDGSTNGDWQALPCLHPAQLERLRHHPRHHGLEVTD
jgi:hypothetical protein